MQSETNSVPDKIQEFSSDNFFCWGKIFIGEQILSEKKNLRFCLRLNFVSDFQCAFWSSAGRSFMM